MEGRFFRGIVVGGIVGAVIASQWDALVRKCPCLKEIKENMLFDDESNPYRRNTNKPKAKTRLMARRHRP